MSLAVSVMTMALILTVFSEMFRPVAVGVV